MLSLYRVRKISGVSAVAGAVLAALTAAPGFAQEAPTANDDVLGWVIVTAQKRSQQLQDVPMSVTALDSDMLENLGAQGFQDYARQVPGLSFESYGVTGLRGVHNIVIRGVSSTGGAATTYGYYIDETPVATVNPRLFDVERVEVLRGPQGTLYGASSMGGTIKIITNKPDASATASRMQLDFSDTEHGGSNYAIDAMLNVPLSEGLALRVVGSYQDDEGYVDRISRLVPEQGAPVEEDVDDDSVWGVRAALRYTPSETTTADLSVQHQVTEVDNLSAFDLNLQRDLTQARDVDERNEETFTLANLTLDFDLGAVSLLSSTSYYEREAIENRELTGLVRQVFGALANPTSLDSVTEDEEFTQELRLSSNSGKRFNWLLGGYYKDRPQAASTDFSAIDTRLPSPPVVNGNLITGGRDVSQEELAFFGEAGLWITPKLEASVGLRWFDTEQTLKNSETGVFAAGANNFSGTESESGTTPRYYIAYHPTDDHMLYAQAAQGFRIGGVNRPVPPGPCAAALAALGLTAAPTSYDSDSLWNYEVGAKTVWFDRRLVANLAAYHIDWTDIQQTVPLSCGFNFTGNVGEASSEGFELELAMRPAPTLDVRATAARTKAVLESAAPALGGQKGERLLHVPEWTFSASIDKTFALTGDRQAYVHADYQWVDDAYDNFNQADPFQVREGYDVTNVRLGVQSGRWDIALYARNLSDEQPILADIGDAGVAGSRKVVTMRPRTIGVALRLDF